MKRSWKEILSSVILSFAAAPGIVLGPEGALEVLVGVDGRVIVLGADASAPAGPAPSPRA
jgi:hypothetical protein